MEPALRPGDWVVGVKRPKRIAVGDVVVIEHPLRKGFLLVKRVAAVGATGLELRGDHAAHSLDSRDFGPVDPDAVHSRLVFVYHPRPRRTL